METWVNIHTGEKINVVGSEWMSNPPIKVHIMEDNSRWQANDFILHHRRLGSDVVVAETLIAESLAEI